jgi:hypothetical protein
MSGIGGYVGLDERNGQLSVFRGITTPLHGIHRVSAEGG